MNMVDIMRILSDVRARNPYPEDIFPKVPITVTNFRKRRDAMFGSEGRRVWNNCIDEILDELKEYIDERREP